MEMREAVKDKEDQQTSKAKLRERVQPKMNKLTIDYQRLHDAFFRFQKTPTNLSKHGEIYYEGKEFESDVKHAQPGEISEELREALNIPPLAPPPWLINMQRYGIPPSYPHLVIPGLNAPIPAGAQWGFHPGGWGRPPVDEFGRPLYGDVFGAAPQQQQQGGITSQFGGSGLGERALWGDLVSSDEEEEEEEESEEESAQEEGGNEGEEQQETGGSKELPDGLITPGGLASVPAGLETPRRYSAAKGQRSSYRREARTLPSLARETDSDPRFHGLSACI